jgi:hypothetical protein
MLRHMSLKITIFTATLLGTGLLGLSHSVNATPSINEMQGCQAVIDFVEIKSTEARSVYSEKDINVVLKGVQAYDVYIQDEIITPGLLQYVGGDNDKAEALQQQVDVYKSGLVESFKKRFPDNRFYTDVAISLNDCAKKAVPSGDALEDLKASLMKIIELAQSH